MIIQYDSEHATSNTNCPVDGLIQKTEKFNVGKYNHPGQIGTGSIANEWVLHIAQCLSMRPFSLSKNR